MRQPDRDTTGILHPASGLQRFSLGRTAPPPELVPVLARTWSVAWDLPPGDAHTQETLPAPCVHLSWDEGRWRVHGPGTRRFTVVLRGRGWVLGARFHPASFSIYTSLPARHLVDRVLDAREVMGDRAPRPVDDVEGARAAIYAALLPAPRLPPDVALANRVVGRALAEPATVTADVLAAEAGISLRSLHRLLERRVGVGTRWIVRRARVQVAAERMARGEPVDQTALARALGYADQAHFIRDFKAQVGHTPAAYRRGPGPPG